ncbi:MAG: FecR family protein [Paucimonas sp.]|nr:FecR family protein [Paucimonas sp.]
MSSQIPPEQAIREQAAEWAVLLDAGCLSPAQEQALAEWRTRDPRHARALEFARATWADLGRLGHLDVPQAVPAAQALPEIPRPLGGRRRRSHLRWASSTAALLLIAVFAVDRAPDVLLRMSADHVTGRGEIRQVTLPDGSKVDLDSRSAISVAYSDSERRVRLLSGDAVFEAAPIGGRESRPFVVEYAGATTRALGTRFVVGEEGQGGWVGMLEHSTRVTLAEPPAERVLNEGESLRYDSRHGIRGWPEQDPRRASAWQRGLLIFEREPLAEVAEQINRYRGGHVLITDSALAQREVSGMFRLDNLDQALVMLTDELKAKRVDVAGLTVIY